MCIRPHYMLSQLPNSVVQTVSGKGVSKLEAPPSSERSLSVGQGPLREIHLIWTCRRGTGGGKLARGLERRLGGSREDGSRILPQAVSSISKGKD